MGSEVRQRGSYKLTLLFKTVAQVRIALRDLSIQDRAPVMRSNKRHDREDDSQKSNQTQHIVPFFVIIWKTSGCYSNRAEV